MYQIITALVDRQIAKIAELEKRIDTLEREKLALVRDIQEALDAPPGPCGSVKADTLRWVLARIGVET